jgi:TonB family protein
VSAQQEGTLQGVVRDELGDGVADASVSLISITRRELVAELRTDSVGAFEFNQLDMDAYDLQVVKPDLCLASKRALRVDREPTTVLLENPEPRPVPKLIRVASIVQQRRLVRTIFPDYPERAIAAGLGGTVTVDIVVDERGVPAAVTSASDRDPLLIQAALAAAEQWRYRVTALNCLPVQVESQIHFNFSAAIGQVRI